MLLLGASMALMDKAWPGPIDRDYLDDLHRIGVRLLDFHYQDALSAPVTTGARWTSWSQPGLGLFVIDVDSKVLMSAAMRSDVELLSIGIVAGAAPSRRYRTILERANVEGAALEMVRLAPGQGIEMALSRGAFRSTTLMACIQPGGGIEGLAPAQLPRPLRDLLAAPPGTILRRRVSPALQRVAEEIIRFRGGQSIDPLFMRSRAYDVMWKVFDLLRREEIAREREPAAGPRELLGLQRVRAAIEQDPATEQSVEALARLAAMNRTKLRELFKQNYGMTISQFRASVRMHAADSLLRATSLSIAEVAYRCGYADPSGFIVAFKRFFGFSPGRLRHDTMIAAGVTAAGTLAAAS